MESGATVVEEAETLLRLEVFDRRALLKLWIEDTPQTIFPKRKLSFLREGYEASFLALAGNPLEDFSNVRKIRLRFKQGHLIVLDENISRASGQPSIANVLAHSLMWQDIDAVLAEYYRLKRDEPQNYNFAESELNSLGYNLLRAHKVQEAVAVFKLNSEAFPHSANVYDSLADAYLAAGEQQDARRCYQRVLELLPQNTHYSADFRTKLEQNARKQLEQLISE